MSTNQPGIPSHFRYNCQRCDAVVAGQLYSAPGSHLMGRAMLEQFVCLACATAHRDHMLSNFWAEAGTPDNVSCGSCGDKLEQGKNFIVHHNMSDSAKWSLAHVCEDCFVDYKSICKDLADGSVKKQEE